MEGKNSPIKEKFVGTWRLVSYEYRKASGELTYPMGHNMMGLLFYDTAGNMAGQLMNPDRLQFANGDKFRGAPEEIKRAFEGYTAYYGTYQIDEEEGCINHRVEASLYPNWIGGVQKRFYEFAGERLILRTPPLHYAGEAQSGTLVWERTG